MSTLDETEEFTIPLTSHLSRLLQLFLPELFKDHAQTQTTYSSIKLPGHFNVYSTPVDMWNSTHCSGELSEELLILFNLFVLKNKCTNNSSSKVHLFTKFEQSRVKYSGCCFYNEKGKGRLSNKAGFLQTHVVLKPLLVLR